MGIADPSAYYPATEARGARPQAVSAPQRDPLAPVFTLGDRAARVGLTIGLAVALLTHGGAGARALTSLSEMREVTRNMRASLHDFFWTHYDVEVDRPPPVERKEEPPPPPEPEPEPEPLPKNTPPPPKDPYDAPPAPAQAQKVLTAPEKASDVEDLTDRGFVTGDGTGPGYGQVSAAGTASAPTYSPHAQVGGKPGGTGTGPVSSAPAVTGPDRSKVAGIVGGTDWNCPFPPEADADQVDFAVASIVVTVRADGTPQSVKVVSDPGHGFGRAARMCALGRRFTPALDRAGQPTVGTTPPIKVRFTR